jgi:hypothetical protein
VEVSGGTVTLAANNAVTEVQETLPAGWQLSSASCIDNNAAVTHNTDTFGTLINGTTLRIPDTKVSPGADLLCTFTNTLGLPTLGFTQTVRVFVPAVFNPPARFGYAASNGWVTQPLESTALFPAKLIGARQPLAAINTATAVTITLPTESGWAVVSVSCSDTTAAASGNSPGTLFSTTSRSFTLPAALIKPNATLLCDVIGLRR